MLKMSQVNYIRDLSVADFSFCPRFAHSKRRKLLLAFAA